MNGEGDGTRVGRDAHTDPELRQHEGPPLIQERRGPVLWLTLNRPHRLNAVSLELYQHLSRAMAELEKDDEVRVVALTGSGRAFSVGADLKSHGEAEPGPEERRRYVTAGQEANRRVQTAPVPVVAAVNGHAVGAGLELALSADLVVVAQRAKLRFPEVGLGTSVGGGVTYTLPERVGAARARELLLLGRFFSGKEAEDMGMALAAVDTHEVVSHAEAVAQELAAKAPISLRWVRHLLRGASFGNREEALAAEAEALLDCMSTTDWKEGIRAFHEGRTPHFLGG